MDWGGSITYLAETRVKGVMTRFGVKDADRAAHLALTGKRGSGRAAFLANMAMQDIARGLGVAVLDGAGNLTQAILGLVPSAARERLVVIDPSDGEHPYSWNALDDFRALPEEAAQECLSAALADLYETPRGVLTDFSAREMLARADATLLLFYDMLDEKGRGRALPKPEARAAFEEALAKEPEAAAFAAEHGRFLAKDVLMRNILGQKESKFTFARLRAREAPAAPEAGAAGEAENEDSEPGIFVIDFSRIRMFPTRILPLVRLFSHAARLYGTPETPIAAYLHDVARYLSPALLESALTGAGALFSVSDTAYGAESTEMREKLLQRAGSVFSFAPAESDVPLVERVFYPYVASDDLERLGAGELIAALTIDSVRSRPFFAEVLPPPPRSGLSTLDLALESREKYAISRLAADKLFRLPPPSDAKKLDEPGSFSNAFRSIFAKQAGGAAGTPAPAAPAGAGAAKSVGPAGTKPLANPAPAREEKPVPRKPVDIPAAELKKMLKVKKRPGRKKKAA